MMAVIFVFVMFLHYFIHNMRIEAVLSRSQQAAIKVLK
jgi:hypothetical protein